VTGVTWCSRAVYLQSLPFNPTLSLCCCRIFCRVIILNDRQSNPLQNPVGLICQSKLNLLELGLAIFGHRFRGIRSLDSWRRICTESHTSSSYGVVIAIYFMARVPAVVLGHNNVKVQWYMILSYVHSNVQWAILWEWLLSKEGYICNVPESRMQE
jgi:hypothetical protein